MYSITQGGGVLLSLLSSSRIFSRHEHLPLQPHNTLQLTTIAALLIDVEFGSRYYLTATGQSLQKDVELTKLTRQPDYVL